MSLSKEELLAVLENHVLPRDPSRIVPLRAAEIYVGGPTILKTLREAGLVKPWKKGYREAQFDKVDLDAAIERIKLHGWPDQEEE